MSAFDHDYSFRTYCWYANTREHQVWVPKRISTPISTNFQFCVYVWKRKNMGNMKHILNCIQLKKAPFSLRSSFYSKCLHRILLWNNLVFIYQHCYLIFFFNISLLGQKESGTAGWNESTKREKKLESFEELNSCVARYVQPSRFVSKISVYQDHYGFSRFHQTVKFCSHRVVEFQYLKWRLDQRREESNHIPRLLMDPIMTHHRL